MYQYIVSDRSLTEESSEAYTAPQGVVEASSFGRNEDTEPFFTSKEPPPPPHLPGAEQRQKHAL